MKRLIDADSLKAKIMGEPPEARYPVWYAAMVDAEPDAQPERLTDDDFETIRIHLNAFKEKLCNQGRWEEARDYERLIDRFMSFASAQPEVKCIAKVTLTDEQVKEAFEKAKNEILTVLPERKTGKWIHKPNVYGVVYCSECDYELHTNNTNFCPNCGVKMEVEHEA